jgi:hypothetical protein
MPRGNNIDREKLLKQKVIFCTECGAELENYCFTMDSNDIEAIKMNLAQCKKHGKFTGEFCSKLFIAGNENLDYMFNNDDYK